MSASYHKIGLESACRRFSLDTSGNPPTTFERQIREIEAGVAALNLSAASVHLGAEIAAFEPDLNDEQRIALILLIVISLAALEEGSTRFPVTGPQSIEPMRRLLNPLCGESFGVDGVESMRLAIERILSTRSANRVIGTSGDDYKPLMNLSPFIYQHRVLSAETALARKLAMLIHVPPRTVDQASIHNLLLQLTTHSSASGGGHFDLSEEQRAAIECAAIAPLTIISGGPGTGKTSIVLAIIKVLIATGVPPEEIALAAPTGKAAYRIGESIRESRAGDSDDRALSKNCPDPITVHRLLGYSPSRRRFRHHRNNPLGAQVVIVDEGSMLDLELMSRLLDAMRRDGRLVILGDADQLPSVSAGAVFRDLVAADGEGNSVLTRNCVRLTRSYRMESDKGRGDSIFKLASAINSGDSGSFVSGIADVTVVRRATAEQLKFVGAEWLDDAASGAFLERWYAAQIRADREVSELEDRVYTELDDGFASAECERLRRVLEKVARSRILCVTRVLDSGSERINAALHRRLAHDKGFSAERERFMVGEPVMVLRNDYQRMLFNGDQGVVLLVTRPGYEAARMAVFARGENFVAFRVDALTEHLELCYAMTVHKAQGSEFDSVALMMPKKDIPILSREILYTAVSRARRSVTIIGSSDVVRAGLARKIDRYSGVREQLAKSLSESQRA